MGVGVVQAIGTAGTWRFLLFLLLLLLCLLGGGGSRNDILSLAYLQPAAVLIAAAMLALPGRLEWRAIKVPFLLLGVLALLHVVQLVPLSPAIWVDLPGHRPFADAAGAAGFAQPSRPISLTPDLTIASLVGLVVPAAVLLGFAALRPDQRTLLPVVLIAGVVASAVLGIAQLAGGASSQFYFYQVTNHDAAVGFFANRNHQAILLAAGFPLLAHWASLPVRGQGRVEARWWVAAALALFLVPTILVTGSRAGLVAAAVSVVVTWLAFRSRFAKAGGSHGSRFRLVPFIVIALGAALVATAILLSRAQAWERLFKSDATEDLRARNLGQYVQMAADFFPFGSGFGSFDPLYRSYERVEDLRPAYLNHAHNDLIELLINGGAGAGLLLLIFLAWWGIRSVGAFRRGSRRSPAVGAARAGSVIILITLLASLADYPLRTPLMAAVLALAAAWLSDGTRKEDRPGNAA
jgi:hypothetical protein